MVRPPGEWLSTAEAAARKGWTRAQLAWAVKRGLPSTRVRARRWIQVAGFDDWCLPSRPDADVYDSATAAAFLGIGRGAFQRLANRTALPYGLVASRRWSAAADLAGVVEQSPDRADRRGRCPGGSTRLWIPASRAAVV